MSLNNIVSFWRRQFGQIREGGFRILLRKIRNFCERFVLYAFARLAVQMGMNWPRAYLFVANEFVNKFKRLRLRDHVDTRELESVCDRAIRCLREYVTHKPRIDNLFDWIEANRALHSFLWNKGKINECLEGIQRVADIQNTIWHEYQLDKLGIIFIPQAFTTGAVGIYENLYTYIKAGILGMHPSKKMILLLESNAPVNNRCYLNYFRRYVSIISDPKLIEWFSPLEKCLTMPLALFMPVHEKKLISHLSLGLIQEQWEKEERPPLLTLSLEDNERGWQCLKSLGVPQGAWFACLHVREPGWRDERSASEDFRNADINTYIPAIELITSVGGWVVRMGDPSMKPLPEMPQVIDYANSNAKSDWMDVFLSGQCRFFIGTASGPFTLSVAFGVPVLVTNLLPVHAIYCLSSKDMFLPRIFWLESEKRYLSFRKLFAPPVGMTSSKASFDKMNFKIIPNDAEEIKDLVMEMLEKLDGVLKYDQEDERLQKGFKALTAECGKLYGDENIVAHARIGRYFLRRHSALLSAEEGMPTEIKVAVERK